ncbi:capsular biosynthesis protein [Bacillus sp. SA1-12]|uniref:CpsD/CapB family tyrosine-protein kinase n=1 Tax=Bacillus sp. SA1-12 TaxID=1455638 RepID=UPI000626759D|nr:CpsD/CapB family tyrosine-protein kinase [Bacillus sp. SA1-12]KKI93241.1 capsular biosynthesis protein [Bacillus sp. SA1-12]
MARKKFGSQLRNLSRNLITMTNPKSPVSEQYRTIRTNIQYSTVDQKIKTLMVTSSNPMEGKSTTVANLAVVFAQQGKKVLVIDADMRKPTVHYTFRVENIVGLINVLSKEASIDQAIQSTENENLFVLSCGPIPPNPAELLESEAMNDLLDSVKEHFDFVIFDTPPILAVTDAQILANKCDGTVLVIHSGKTEIDLAQKAKDMLVDANGKYLGVVLNAKKQQLGQHYYYYGGK